MNAARAALDGAMFRVQGGRTMTTPPPTDDESASPPLGVAFGRSLKAAREAAGMTQEDVAKIAGPKFRFQTVSRIERGELPNLTVATMDALARAVNCALVIEMRRNGGASRVVLTPL